MALTNKGLEEILSEAGVDAAHMEKAKADIMYRHNATKNAIQEERDNAIKERDDARKERDALKADAEKLTEVQKELETVKGGDWENKYNTLLAENAAKEARAAKQTALDALLKDAFTPDGAEIIRKHADLSAVELTKDGAIKGAEKLLEGLKTEWKPFVKTTTTTGADIPNPPTNAAPSGGMSREDILSIKDDAELVRAIEANPGAFGLN